MAIVELENMSFYGFHGCFEEEQKIGTNFRVDLEFEADTFKAEKSDNINDTVNYLSVYQTVKKVFDIPSHLLENVARRICGTLLDEYPANKKLSGSIHAHLPCICIKSNECNKKYAQRLARLLSGNLYFSFQH